MSNEMYSSPQTGVPDALDASLDELDKLLREWRSKLPELRALVEKAKRTNLDKNTMDHPDLCGPASEAIRELLAKWEKVVTDGTTPLPYEAVKYSLAALQHLHRIADDMADTGEAQKRLDRTEGDALRQRQAEERQEAAQKAYDEETERMRQRLGVA